MMLIDEIKSEIDELITANGEPFDDSIILVQYILTRALSQARSGMGDSEAQILEQILTEAQDGA